jgi:hypothetical protein
VKLKSEYPDSAEAVAANRQRQEGPPERRHRLDMFFPSPSFFHSRSFSDDRVPPGINHGREAVPFSPFTRPSSSLNLRLRNHRHSVPCVFVVRSSGFPAKRRGGFEPIAGNETARLSFLLCSCGALQIIRRGGGGYFDRGRFTSSLVCSARPPDQLDAYQFPGFANCRGAKAPITHLRFLDAGNKR